jgi:hypothetical protein
MEWCGPTDVSGVNIGSKGDQKVYNPMRITETCPMQGRALLRIYNIYVVENVIKVVFE